MIYVTTILRSYEKERRQKTDDGFRLRLDNKTDTDVYPGFCNIFAYLPREDDSVWGYPEIILELKNAPYNDEVHDFVKHHAGEFTAGEPGATIRLALKPGDSSMIRSLAKVIRRVIGRGQAYDNQNWRWIARRTVDSLNIFATVLADATRAWKTQPTPR